MVRRIAVAADFSGLFIRGRETNQTALFSFECNKMADRNGPTVPCTTDRSKGQISMMEVSVSVPRDTALSVASGGAETHNDLGAAEMALIDRELCQQLQRIIQLYDRLVGPGFTRERDLSSEVNVAAPPSQADRYFHSAHSGCCHLSACFWRETDGFKLAAVRLTS